MYPTGRPESLSSLGSPWGSLGSFGFTQGDVWGRWVHSGASWGSLTGCLGSLGFVLEVVGFFRGLLGWVVGFTGVRPGVNPELLGS